MGRVVTTCILSPSYNLCSLHDVYLENYTGKNLPITTVVNPNSRCFSNYWESFTTVVF